MPLDSYEGASFGSFNNSRPCVFQRFRRKLRFTVAEFISRQLGIPMTEEQKQQRQNGGM